MKKIIVFNKEMDELFFKSNHENVDITLDPFWTHWLSSINKIVNCRIKS